MVQGKPYALRVTFTDGQLSGVALHREMALPEAACRTEYEALIAQFERRFGPARPAEAYSYKSHTVLDVADGEEAMVERHPGLQSTTTLYRSYEVPQALITRFGSQADELSVDMRFRSAQGAIRCTGLSVSIR